MYFELTTNESQKLINIIMIYKNIIDELQIQKKKFLDIEIRYAYKYLFIFKMLINSKEIQSM